MEQLKAIRSLISYLPHKDIELAKRFIDTRDFESLQMLVSSSIIRTRKGIKRGSKEYLDIDVGKLLELKTSIDTYCLGL